MRKSVEEASGLRRSELIDKFVEQNIDREKAQSLVDIIFESSLDKIIDYNNIKADLEKIKTDLAFLNTKVGESRKHDLVKRMTESVIAGIVANQLFTLLAPHFALIGTLMMRIPESRLDEVNSKADIVNNIIRSCFTSEQLETLSYSNSEIRLLMKRYMVMPINTILCEEGLLKEEDVKEGRRSRRWDAPLLTGMILDKITDHIFLVPIKSRYENGNIQLPVQTPKKSSNL